MSPNRRWLLLLLGTVLGVALSSVAHWYGVPRAAPAPAPTDPAGALAELRTGNARYVASHRALTTDTASDGERRLLLAKGQHPFAAVLCCADSRICPEFIFDQYVGSIFEIRNAGN